MICGIPVGHLIILVIWTCIVLSAGYHIVALRRERDAARRELRRAENVIFSQRRTMRYCERMLTNAWLSRIAPPTENKEN